MTDVMIDIIIDYILQVNHLYKCSSDIPKPFANAKTLDTITIQPLSNFIIELPDIHVSECDLLSLKFTSEVYNQTLLVQYYDISVLMSVDFVHPS